MPEASVNKNRQFHFFKIKIRFTNKCDFVCLASRQFYFLLVTSEIGFPWTYCFCHESVTLYGNEQGRLFEIYHFLNVSSKTFPFYMLVDLSVPLLNSASLSQFIEPSVLQNKDVNSEVNLFFALSHSSW